VNSEEHNSAAVEDFALAIGMLLRRLRADAAPELHEINWTQKAILTRLEKNGPSTAADLARAEGVKPQSMGTALAFLEEKGFVERQPHPTDGRQMNIKLTAKGITLRRTTRDAAHKWLSQAIAKLDKREQATIFKAGELIKRMVEAA
jgi:DNA-binding MarR family transcriptional regulator